jgi:OOP family OmpA-OmpF porin
VMWKQRVWMLGLAAVCVPAHSADEAGRWYVAPKAGYTFLDSDRGDLDDDAHYGFGIGKHLSPSWSLELNALTGQHDGSSGAELDLSAFSVDLLRVFNREASVSPFISLGAGALNLDPQGPGRQEDFMAQAGIGLNWRFWENAADTRSLSLRPEVKARWQEAGAGDATDYLATVSLVFSYGAEAVAPPALPPPPAPAAPLPPPEPVAPPPPKDTDGDGVLDDQDRCAGTPRGVAVDAEGCPRKGSITLTGVTFENDSAVLTGGSHAALDAVAADLAKYRRLKVELQGHTDSVGTAAYNLKLSQRRADAVREYLVSRGVGAEQLSARGYGEGQPVADNGTADGRAQNRRVAMSVVDNPGDVEVKNESATP